MSVPVSGLFVAILNLHENDAKKNLNLYENDAKKTTVLRMRMMLRQIELRPNQVPPEEGSTCSSRAPAGLRAIIFRRARFTWRKDTKSQNNN